MEQAIEQRQSLLYWTGMCRMGSMVMSGMILVGLLSGLVFGQDKENWDQVIAAAKKERKVVIYGSSTFRPAVKEIEPEFMKLYDIKVEYLTGRSREVRERVNTEVRTGKQVADVAHGGGTSMPALWQDGGLANWLPPSLKAVRPEILKSMDIPDIPITPITVQIEGGLLINTNLVPPAQEPKSWKDLADPKWRGKILMDDPRAAGAGNVWFISTLRYPSLGVEFHKRLAQNKPVFLGTGTFTQIEGRVAQGEYPMGLPTHASVIVEHEGAPLKWISPQEGIAWTVMGLGLVKNAPRSNAAKLFINFALSEKFQRVLGKQNAPVRMGVEAGRKEWSLDHVVLLPRSLAPSAKEREKFYRMAESLYGIR
ncbi:MAG: extracellular solute-binding protein [Deltaproteobacteria bacterium]|nr:extracellular solute-binding protein [Deltaproteobacteria bacterium]